MPVLREFADAIDTSSDASSRLVSQDAARALAKACEELITKCQQTFHFEVCAIFLVRGNEVHLQAQRGYEYPDGTPIAASGLKELSYKLGLDGQRRYDGITGLVASTGTEVRFNSWAEIKTHKSYVGKPDQLGIWSPKRPFRCMCAVPLKLRGKTIGVLKVENKNDPRHPAATFDDVDRQLLRTLALIFSKAVEETVQSVDDFNRIAFLEDFLADDPAVRVLLYDHENMAAVIEGFPDQIDRALRSPVPLPRSRGYRRVIVVGMGGSALPVEVIQDAFGDQLRVPLSVTRHYSLPRIVDRDTLVIASSFSGTTEETLGAISECKRGAENVVVLTGGAGRALERFGSERGFPVIRIPLDAEPPGFQPRSAVGYMVTLLCRFLAAAGAMEDVEGELKEIATFLRSFNKPEVHDEAKNIAAWLKDRVPVIYTDEVHVASIARITKIKFNENAKRPAFFNSLPEANHNEMIGFAKRGLGDYGVLYMHDPSSHHMIERRYEVMQKVFLEQRAEHVEFRKWTMPDALNGQKIFASLLFAELCSYELALLDGIDPTPVELVERFKKLLTEEEESRAS